MTNKAIIIGGIGLLLAGAFATISNANPESSGGSLGSFFQPKDIGNTESKKAPDSSVNDTISAFLQPSNTTPQTITTTGVPAQPSNTTPQTITTTGVPAQPKKSGSRSGRSFSLNEASNTGNQTYLGGQSRETGAVLVTPKGEAIASANVPKKSVPQSNFSPISGGDVYMPPPKITPKPKKSFWNRWF